MLTVGLGLDDDDNDALDFVIEVKHFVLDLNIFSSLSERSSKAERSVAEVGAAGLCLLILVGVFFYCFSFFFRQQRQNAFRKPGCNASANGNK